MPIRGFVKFLSSPKISKGIFEEGCVTPVVVDGNKNIEICPKKGELLIEFHSVLYQCYERLVDRINDIILDIVVDPWPFYYDLENPETPLHLNEKYQDQLTKLGLSTLKAPYIHKLLSSTDEKKRWICQNIVQDAGVHMKHILSKTCLEMCVQSAERNNVSSCFLSLEGLSQFSKMVSQTKSIRKGALLSELTNIQGLKMKERSFANPQNKSLVARILYDECSFNENRSLLIPGGEYTSFVTNNVKTSLLSMGYNVEVSDHKDFGEGEFKVAARIRLLQNKKNEGDIIVRTTDGDMILLCLIEQHRSNLKYEDKDEYKNKKSDIVIEYLAQEQDVIYFIHVKKCVESLKKWWLIQMNDVDNKNNASTNKSINDLFFLISMFGNDIVPKHRYLEIGNLVQMFDSYAAWKTQLGINNYILQQIENSKDNELDDDADDDQSSTEPIENYPRYKIHIHNFYVLISQIKEWEFAIIRYNHLVDQYGHIFIKNYFAIMGHNDPTQCDAFIQKYNVYVRSTLTRHSYRNHRLYNNNSNGNHSKFSVLSTTATTIPPKTPSIVTTSILTPSILTPIQNSKNDNNSNDDDSASSPTIKKLQPRHNSKSFYNNYMSKFQMLRKRMKWLSAATGPSGEMSIRPIKCNQSLHLHLKNTLSLDVDHELSFAWSKFHTIFTSSSQPETTDMDSFKLEMFTQPEDVKMFSFDRMLEPYYSSANVCEPVSIEKDGTIRSVNSRVFLRDTIRKLNTIWCIKTPENENKMVNSNTESVNEYLYGLSYLVDMYWNSSTTKNKNSSSNSNNIGVVPYVCNWSYKWPVAPFFGHIEQVIANLEQRDWEEIKSKQDNIYVYDVPQFSLEAHQAYVNPITRSTVFGGSWKIVDPMLFQPCLDIANKTTNQLRLLAQDIDKNSPNLWTYFACFGTKPFDGARMIMAPTTHKLFSSVYGSITFDWKYDKTYLDQADDTINKMKLQSTVHISKNDNDGDTSSSSSTSSTTMTGSLSVASPPCLNKKMKIYDNFATPPYYNTNKRYTSSQDVRAFL